MAFFRLRIIQIEKKNFLKIFHFFENFDPKWPFLAQIWGPIWSKGPKNNCFDFFAPWTWKIMGHMIKFARISKNGFLSRFGTVRPKFWALKFFLAFLLNQQLNTMEMSLNMQKNMQKNPIFGPIWDNLGLFGPFWRQNICFSKIRKRHFSRLIKG